MRILFVTPYVPSKIRVRPYHFIKTLSRRHEIHLVTLTGFDKGEDESIDELRSFCDVTVVKISKREAILRCLLALPTPAPLCAAYTDSAGFRDAVAEKMAGQTFDIVHVEHLRASVALPRVIDIPTVYDSVDCLTGLFSQMSGKRKNPAARLLMAEEAFKLKFYEPKAARRFAKTIITSETEKMELSRYAPDVDISVVGNGVDTEYFVPPNAAKNPRMIVYSGKMSYAPNAEAALWFANNVFPILKERYPETEYVIVGADPTDSVRSLGNKPGITVTGYVDDIRPFLASASVAVAPMLTGVGVQNKVLEAMAMGLPVVLSSIAMRPFGDRCQGLIPVDDENRFIKEISDLFDDHSLAVETGEKARKTVTMEYSWDEVVRLLESVYEEIT